MSVLSASGFLTPTEADAYSAALLDLLGEQDPVVVLRETPAVLRQSLSRFTNDQLEVPERPGKWSAATMMAHLADSELVGAFRLRMILAHDRPALMPYDQDLWAARLHYDRTPAGASLERFTVLRQANLTLWAAATEAELARVGIHGERGEESIQRMRRLYAGHDLAHRRQLDRIRRALD